MSTSKKTSSSKSKKASEGAAFNESRAIKLFISRILDKNYNEANKYLTDVLDNKLQGRIADQLANPLF